MEIATRAKLDEIRERESKATQGEWYVMPTGFSRSVPCPTVYAAKDELKYIAFCKDVGMAEITDNFSNADFIAHSRTDVPLLLDTIDTLVTALKDTVSFLGCDSAGSALCFDCVASSKCSSAECFQYRGVTKLLKGME